MIFAIAAFITKLTGWDVSKVQRYVFWSLAGVIVILCVAVGLWVKSCASKPPKLDQKEIQRAQTAIAEQDRKEMIQVLAESDAKEKAADATAVEANTVTVNAIAESKAKWSNASNEEMAAELERRAKESQ